MSDILKPISILSYPKASKGYIYVYALQDPTTEEICYVGKTNDPPRRYSEHSNDFRLSNFWNAWLTYLDQVNKNFEMLIVDCVPESEADEKEREIISLYWATDEPLMNQNHLHRGGVGISQKKVWARIERCRWYRQYRINNGNDPDEYWWNDGESDMKCGICGDKFEEGDCSTLREAWLQAGGMGSIPIHAIVHPDCNAIEQHHLKSGRVRLEDIYRKNPSGRL